MTEDALREPLRQLLTQREPMLPDGFPGTPAAVLVPLFARSDGVHVWFVRRPSRMRAHAGQVAFPGGKRDAADASLRVTALRETHEEIGFAPEHIDVLGALDAFPTITGYVITPYVGWVPAHLEPVPSADEVDRVFSVPLRRFLDEPDKVPAVITGSGYLVDGEVIWGATAAVAWDLGVCVRRALESAAALRPAGT